MLFKKAKIFVLFLMDFCNKQKNLKLKILVKKVWKKNIFIKKI